jgi:hypothetical protein
MKLYKLALTAILVNFSIWLLVIVIMCLLGYGNDPILKTHWLYLWGYYSFKSAIAIIIIIWVIEILNSLQ